MKNKYKSYKRRCKSKGLEFSLSFWKFCFYIQQKCYICSKDNSGGLDRVDNSIGYVEKNIYPCCFDCNRLKSNKTIQQFKEYLVRLNPSHKLLTGFNKLNNYTLYEKKRKCIHRFIIEQSKNLREGH